MGTVIAAALGGAAAALLLVALVGGLRRSSRSRADLEEMLAAAQGESDALRARLESLTAQLPARSDAGQAHPAGTAAATYVITDAGTAALQVPPHDQVHVPDRIVLTATVGKPLVKVVALGHGVRRALSPESRNRIWFEMRKQVRSSRKRRRRQVRDLQRQVRADERARETLA